MRYNIKWINKFHIFLIVFYVGAFAKTTEKYLIYISKNVLFINGYDLNIVPHSFRYRVLH